MKTLAVAVAIWFSVTTVGLAALWLLRSYTEHRTRQRINRLIGEDREVASLDAIWELPAFDPRQAA